MKDKEIDKAVSILKEDIRRWKVPALGVVQEETRDPFQILVSCVISLRTKDAVTEAASMRLFEKARTAETLAKLPIKTIERAIYPASFFRVKARTLRGVSRDILSRFGGKVPDTIEDLVSLKGVGRKTANLVVTLGFNKPGICVDVHVHRISNRWGYIKTRNPKESETALRVKLPKKHWIVYNDLLVPYGQNLCTPISPWCSRCRLEKMCGKIGVKTKR
jgi:endonuclease-3